MKSGTQKYNSVPIEKGVTWVPEGRKKLGRWKGKGSRDKLNKAMTLSFSGWSQWTPESSMP